MLLQTPNDVPSAEEERPKKDEASSFPMVSLEGMREGGRIK
jgi:hypothetical protein